MSRKSRAKAEARRKAEYERDLKEVGDIKSACGNGTIKLAGLKPPTPNRFVSRRSRDQVRAAQESGLR